jgi:hypothetical protein
MVIIKDHRYESKNEVSEVKETTHQDAHFDENRSQW